MATINTDELVTDALQDCQSLRTLRGLLQRHREELSAEFLPVAMKVVAEWPGDALSAQKSMLLLREQLDTTFYQIFED